MLDEVII